MHIVSVHEVKEFKCLQCDFEAKSRHYLRNHYLVKSTNVIIAIMNQQRKYTFRNTLNQFMKVELSHVHNVISKQNINKTLKDTLQIFMKKENFNALFVTLS